MTAALLELETIDADQINDIMAGLPPRPPKPSSAPPASRADNTPGPEPTAPRPPDPPHQPGGSPEICGGSAVRIFFMTQNFHCGRFVLNAERPLIMGIVNLSDDSFSGDGLHGDTEPRSRRPHRLIEEGAHILDIGAESSRPGARRYRLNGNRTACCR
jgi:hypothetical protein